MKAKHPPVHFYRSSATRAAFMTWCLLPTWQAKVITAFWDCVTCKACKKARRK